MIESMLKDICDSDIFGSIFDTLSVNLFSDEGKYSAAFQIAEQIYESAIMPFAVMLLFVYFAIAMFDKLSQENFTWEQLGRTLAMLLVSKFLIEHGFDILKLLFEIGLAVTDLIDDWVVYNGDQYITNEAVQEKLLADFREKLGVFNIPVLREYAMFSSLIMPWLLSWIMRLCVSIICYSRVIEIYVRASLAPIALADFFHSGLQSNGWRFLKSFLAVCLQGGMILVIAAIFSALFKQIYAHEGNLFTYFGSYFAFYAAAVMLMFKSLSLTKEIVGAN